MLANDGKAPHGKFRRGRPALSVQAFQALPYLLTMTSLAGFVGRSRPPAAAAVLSPEGTVTTIDRLFEAARAAQAQAYAPYSKFPVGAAVLTGDGAVFAGCNVENAAYPSGVCAESAAIAAMAVAGGRQIVEVLVVGGDGRPIAPCGACRQRLMEFSTRETQVHLADASGPRETFLLIDLLPRAFGPRDLDDGSGGGGTP